MIIDFNGISPTVSPSAFTAEGSRIIGNVTLCEDSSVWFNAVLRGDEAKITLGKGSNIQDNCTVHCDESHPVVIGENVTVGHNAVIHGCSIGDGSLIGMNATVLNGAKIGKNCLVGAGGSCNGKQGVSRQFADFGSASKEGRRYRRSCRRKNHRQCEILFAACKKI